MIQRRARIRTAQRTCNSPPFAGGPARAKHSQLLRITHQATAELEPEAGPLAAAAARARRGGLHCGRNQY